MAAKRVCVVGAGPSGLVTTKTLLQAGLKVDCFETSPDIGGHWVLNNPSGRSAAYHSLETNTTKYMSRLSDFTMPEDWPDFPSCDQVRQWFCDYADHFDVRRHVQTDCEVVSAEPAASGPGWNVTIQDNDGTNRTETYDGLIAASGNYWQPKQVTYDGHFDGTILHTLGYRAPDDPLETKGKHVIVVGIGTTGCELACELAASEAASVTLSARSGNWILPKRMGGDAEPKPPPLSHPTDPVPLALRILPQSWRVWVFEQMVERTFKKNFTARMARFEELGLPPPPPSPLTKRPTLAQDLLGLLEKGAVTAKPGIKRTDGRTVTFTDGTSVEADIIFNAVGYHLSYPYLPQDIVDTSDDDLELFLGTNVPTRDDLFIVGASRPMGAFWPIAEAQATYAAAILSGQSKLPPQRERTKRAEPILKRRSFNPALYGLSIREEILKRRLN